MIAICRQIRALCRHFARIILKGKCLACNIECRVEQVFILEYADLLNCLLRGMKGLEAHFIMRGDAQPAFKKRVEYPMHYKLKMSWTNLKNKGS